MTSTVVLDDLELAALISSRICHDVIGPVGAIYNCLEVYDEGENADSQAYAIDGIRSSTSQASAKLQFARFAFGAAGSVGGSVDLASTEGISRGFVETGRHKLVWDAPVGHMAKNKVKLLLNMLASSVSALPRGGEVRAVIRGSLDKPQIEVRCSGANARWPQHLREMIDGVGEHKIDVHSVQPYYTCRLARACGMALTLVMEGGEVVLRAVGKA